MKLKSIIIGQSGGPTTVINASLQGIIEAALSNPNIEHIYGALNGIGKPEKLKNRPEYSRRIDDANHLVYVIDELQNIKIIACRGHYYE